MEFIEPFLLGGTIVAGSKMLSTMVDPAYAAMVGGMPTGIIASFFLANDSQKRQFYKGYGISDVIVAITINMIVFITMRWSSIPVNTISIIGYLLWLVFSFIGIRMYAVKK